MKIKKSISVLLSLLLVFSLVSVAPLTVAAEETSDWSYVVNDNCIIITHYNGDASVVTVPDAIDGYPVYVIGNSAFEDSAVKEVILPDTVLKFYDNAFKNCANLTTLCLPDGFVGISANAFVGCNNYLDVTLPCSMEYIAPDAFDDNPNRVFHVCEGSLGYSYVMQKGFAYDFSGNGNYFETMPYSDGVAVSRYTGTGSAVTIPQTIDGQPVRAIDSYAFQGSSVSVVVLPSTLQNICNSAFEGCNNLSSINLPEGLQSIDYNAFAGCNSLLDVVLPVSLAHIDYGAFDTNPSRLFRVYQGTVGYNYVRQNNFTYEVIPGYEPFEYESFQDGVMITHYTGVGGEVIVPDTLGGLPVRRIDSNAFSENGYSYNGSYPEYTIDYIELPDTLQELGDSVFRNLPVHSIRLPWNLDMIPIDAFEGCTNLDRVENLERVRVIGDYAFAGCTNLYDVRLYEIVDIGRYAFTGCTQLNNVMLGYDTLRTIGERAFSGCNMLSNLYLPSSVEHIEDYAFENMGGMAFADHHTAAVDEYNYRAAHMYTSAQIEVMNHNYRLLVTEWSPEFYYQSYPDPVMDPEFVRGLDGQMLPARLYCVDNSEIANAASPEYLYNYPTPSSNMDYMQLDAYITIESFMTECTNEGYATLIATAEYNGEIFTEYKNVRLYPTGHHMTQIPEAPATCTSEGMREHWYCDTCGMYFDNEQGDMGGYTDESTFVIPTTPHQMTYIEGCDATCEADGMTPHWRCDICGKYFADEWGSGMEYPDEAAFVLAKVPHTLEYVPMVEPQVGIAGCLEYWRCTECGKTFSDSAGEIEVDITALTIPAPERAKGDFDGDGVLTVNEATTLQRFLCEMVDETDEDYATILAYADVNADGKVNVKDVTAIQRKVAGLE